MDLNSQIREALSFIVRNYQSETTSGVRSTQLGPAAEMGHKLIAQIDGKDKNIERLYFLYYLCEIVSHLSFEDASRFIQILFPSPLNQRQANLMSQLISLSLSLRNEQMLHCTAKYLIDCDKVTISSDNILPSTLAEDSPQFCSALISKGYFLSNGVSKSLLADWLNTLINFKKEKGSGNETTLLMNSVIRFSLLDGQINSNLHLSILSVIQQKVCQSLSNQFLVDLATVISQRSDKIPLSDLFAQIVIVANAGGTCSLSKQLKHILLSKFPFNNLINAICK